MRALHPACTIGRTEANSTSTTVALRRPHEHIWKRNSNHTFRMGSHSGSLCVFKEQDRWVCSVVALSSRRLLQTRNVCSCSRWSGLMDVIWKCLPRTTLPMWPKNEDTQDTWTISIHSLSDYSSDNNLTQKHIELSVTLLRSFVMTWKTEGRADPPASECGGEFCMSFVKAVQYMLHMGKCLSLIQNLHNAKMLELKWMNDESNAQIYTASPLEQYSYSFPDQTLLPFTSGGRYFASASVKGARYQHLCIPFLIRL